MIHELRLFFVALQFLTRVPVPRWVGFESAWLQTCLRHFPLVGACVGLWASAVLWATLQWWPPLVAAALSTIATIWLTGAFHEDGLADTFDALGGAVDRERALVIMKDSRIGSYGAVALVSSLVLKVTLVSTLATSDAPVFAVAAMVWSHAASRAAPVWLVATLGYAGDAEHAKAKPLAMRIDRGGVAVSLAWMVLVSAAAFVVIWTTEESLSTVFIACIACTVATLACARWLRRRLGGFTGDTLGATQQIVELVGLLAWSAMSGIGDS